MRSGKIISLSVWLMIIFNLILSFAAVWNYQRMNPEIEGIFQRNIISIDACEKMFLVLARDTVNPQEFNAAFDVAVNNITEDGEKETLQNIKSMFEQYCQGNTQIKSQLIEEIVKLNNFNKQAIADSARKAQQLRQSGAWGVVLMTTLFFVAAIFFEQRLRRALLAPLQEISMVLEADRKGDKFRRCHLPGISSDMKKLFEAINSLLDRKN
jgi:methyl-accepting chemotaxis protein